MLFWQRRPMQLLYKALTRRCEDNAQKRRITLPNKPRYKRNLLGKRKLPGNNSFFLLFELLLFLFQALFSAFFARFRSRRRKRFIL